jgi:hypothetical protein
MIRHGKPPYLECSSRGDFRFSSFYARIQSRGNRSIEEIYQAAKIFKGSGGKLVTGYSWREAKGKRAINMPEVAEFFSKLWDEYIEENPILISDLLQASGLSDVFGQDGHVCQATELWRIRARFQTIVDKNLRRK